MKEMLGFKKGKKGRGEALTDTAVSVEEKTALPSPKEGASC